MASQSTDAPALELLQAIRLACPTLPVGAYAYSQGLEYAVESGWVRDAKTTLSWVSGMLGQVVGEFDVPLLCRLYRAYEAGELSRAVYWEQRVLAGRESAELREEELHLGAALVRLLSDLNHLTEPPPSPAAGHTYLGAFALAALSWSLSETSMLTSYCFAWLEHQTSAAMRLVPLGHTDGQRLLSRCLGQVQSTIDHGLTVGDDEIGALAPGQAMASALHETQYSRLFRS